MDATTASRSDSTTSQAYYNPRPCPVAPRIIVEEFRTSSMGAAREDSALLHSTAGASSLSSVFTLCNTAIGAGVLGLPYAFQCAGLVGCLVLFVLVAGLESLTMYVLAKFSERYDAGSYGTLIRRALGRKTGAGLSAVTVLYLWGSSVAYLVVVADTFTNLSAMHFGPEVWCSQRGWLLLVVGVMLLPMCFPRNLSALEYVSGAAVLGFIYTAIAVSTRGIQAAAARPQPWADIKLVNVDIKALYAVSILVFGLNCHANVVSVFWELDHYPHRLISRLPTSPMAFHALGSLAPKPSTYKLIGMLGAIIAYMIILMLGYAAVGITGYLAFPTNVSSNILNSFASDDVAIQVARAAIGGVCIGSYPLNHHPARKAWEDLFDAAANIKVLPRWTSALLTTAFVASTVATAAVVTDLGSVLHMIGGTAASFMVFLLPGLLLMNAAIIKHTVGRAGAAAVPSSSSGAGGSSDHQQPLLGDQAEDPSSAAAELPGDGGEAAVDVTSALVLRTQSGHLVHKKAGFRTAGFIFAPGKSWFLGLLLVVVSLLVMLVTLLTAGS